MLQKLLQEANRLQASDLHLTAGYKPYIRLQGKLQILNDIVLDDTAILNCIDIILTDKNKLLLSKQGEFDCSLEVSFQRYRINIYKEKGHYSLAIRLLASKIPSCLELHLPKSVQNLVWQYSGLLLLTGITGSGKSTTLAALVEYVNQNRFVHIITLEDPVEYCYQSKNSLIHQREIGSDTQSFAEGLRSALRQDPDIIILGELRDAETLKIALTASLTGHLVIATLHAKDAISSINRIIDNFQDKYIIKMQLAECLLGVVSQQLFLRSDGKGRIAAFEVLIITAAIRNIIREGNIHQIQSYMQTGGNNGMQTMSDAISSLRCQGIIK